MLFLEIQNSESFPYSYNTADESTLQFYIQHIIFLYLWPYKDHMKREKTSNN